ncbi:hypothetical protein PR048_024872 [Dryococelus australis]|uniref:Uncharacterized protein n=1 Tax=Dryococelus australis TaxID=614101 RepID=A0ABQ9GPR7_9NEOP|nr:hypothetical protein PR048_024872 [Dryococelus australis]
MLALVTHLPLGLDGLELAMRHLAHGLAAPQFERHACVAHQHDRHRHQVRQSQEHDVVPATTQQYHESSRRRVFKAKSLRGKDSWRPRDSYAMRLLRQETSRSRHHEAKALRVAVREQMSTEYNFWRDRLPYGWKRGNERRRATGYRDSNNTMTEKGGISVHLQLTAPNTITSIPRCVEAIFPNKNPPSPFARLTHFQFQVLRDRGGPAGRALAAHQGNTGSIPNRSVRFLGDLLFLSPLHYDAAPYPPRFTLIGSQDFAVKCSRTSSAPLHSSCSSFRPSGRLGMTERRLALRREYGGTRGKSHSGQPDEWIRRECDLGKGDGTREHPSQVSLHEGSPQASKVEIKAHTGPQRALLHPYPSPSHTPSQSRDGMHTSITLGSNHMTECRRLQPLRNVNGTARIEPRDDLSFRASAGNIKNNT